MQLENSKRRFPHTANGKIDHEDLLVDAMIAHAQGKGVTFEDILSWIARDTGTPDTIDMSFKLSAKRAFQRGLRRGRLVKRGDLYYVNPDYVRMFSIFNLLKGITNRSNRRVSFHLHNL
jgi:hypothetical protein